MGTRDKDKLRVMVLSKLNPAPALVTVHVCGFFDSNPRSGIGVRTQS